MNCVMIVLDSLDCTRVQKSKYDLLPFLNRMAKKGISAVNMYSEAPYTEAAEMALYCGQHTLDHSGYLRRFGHAPKLLFENFSDNGYSVFFNDLQPQCYPSALRRGITDIYYNRGYDASVLWSYRFAYYADLYKLGKLNENDYSDLIEILEDNFGEWRRFLNDLIVHDPSVELISGLNGGFDAGAVLKSVESEYKLFTNAPEEYVKGILEQGKKHRLFQIPYFEQTDHGISKTHREAIDRFCKRLCKTIQRKNLSGNALHNKEVYSASGKAIAEFLRTRNCADFLNSMYLVKNALFPVHLRDRYGKNGPTLKGQPSFHTMAQQFLDWLDTRTDEKPYFSCIHTDDIHFPEVFFTYDSDDMDVVMDDLRVAEHYLSERSGNVPGTVIHDLSLLYIDHQCEWFYEQMAKRGALKDTIFVVTADHGFSYSGYPIRKKAINTFYLENFKIPFFVFGPGVERAEYGALQSSVAVPATVSRLMGIDSAGFEPPIRMEGLPYCFVEYCGGGCPDLSRREIMLAAFDKERMVACRAPLCQRFSADSIVEVYDLAKDPLQKKNLAKCCNRAQYSALIDAIGNRFEAIRAAEGLSGPKPV